MLSTTTAIRELGFLGHEGLVDGNEQDLDPERGFVWQEIRRVAEVDAVYFHDRVPVVAFASIRSGTVGDLHRRLWNLGRLPLLVAEVDGTIRFMSCYAAPSNDRQLIQEAVLAEATTEAEISSKEIFKQPAIDAGTFREEYQSKFQEQSKVDRHLLANLRHLRGEFKDSDEKLRALDRLIGKAIFVRYFEDRQLISASELRDICGVDNLAEALEGGALTTIALLNGLAEQFNGDIFRTATSDLEALEEPDLGYISAVLHGAEAVSGQQSFWPYEFSVIPADLIGFVYEQFLGPTQRLEAAYYTPRSLVGLVLNEVLPWTDIQTANGRVLDPACGSGIFLTETLRRLLFGRRLNLGRPLSFDEGVQVLSDRIFGIDRNQLAIEVSALSLYLALLEEVGSPAIDEQLPPLIGTNLIHSDFFDDQIPFPNGYFTFVVGNPPWKSSLDSAAESYLGRIGHKVPDRQLAHLFLKRAEELTEFNGRIGLLLPAKSFLHNRSATATKARRAIFERLDIESIIDLSPFRRSIFSAAVAPSIILVAVRREPDNSDGILYVAPKPTPMHRSIDDMVISLNDSAVVPYHIAKGSGDIWKTLLWGTFDDFDLINKLRSRFTSVKMVAKARQWTTGQGFQINGGDENDASYLLGVSAIDTESVLPFRLAFDNDEVVTSTTMHRPRKSELYDGPHVLVRRGLVDGRIAAVYLDRRAAHTNGILGIAGPPQDSALLKLLTAYINSSIGAYFYFLTSSSWGVEREFIEVAEYLSLPFPIPDGALISRIVRLVDAYSNGSGLFSDTERARTELDDLVWRSYGLNAADIDRVRDLFSLGLDQFRANAQATAYESTDPEMMAAYYDRLVLSLRSLIPSVPARLAGSFVQGSFRITSISLGTEQNSSAALPEEIFQEFLDPDQNGAPYSVRLMPQGIYMADERIDLVKPNQQRFWTKSEARRDAGDIAGALLAG